MYADIKVIKQSIENKTIGDSPIIFVCDDYFVPNQYITEIGKIKNKVVEYVDSFSLSSSLFGNPSNSIRVFRTDEFEFSQLGLLDETNLYIICKKIGADCRELYGDIILPVPKLEVWQIEDFATSRLQEIPEKDVRWLCEICKYDIHRISREIDKILLFSPVERLNIFNECVQQGLYEDLSNNTVFDFTNAIMKKDIKTMFSLYKKIGVVDIEPLGVVTILKKNFEDLITVQMHSNPSPEICGIKPNRFWAIRHNCGIWTSQELLKNYRVLLGIDELVKTGKIGTNIELIDYVLCSIM